MNKIWRSLIRLFYNPKKVLVLCVLSILFALVFDGSLWRLYSLHRQINKLEASRQQALEETKILEIKIKKANDPRFLELQARERFNWVNEDELVFIFAKSE